MMTDNKLLKKAIKQLLEAKFYDDASYVKVYADDTTTSRTKRYVINNVIWSVRMRLALIRRSESTSDDVKRLCMLIKTLQDLRATVPFTRLRKGRRVTVPEEWVGVVVTSRTKHKRKEFAREKRRARRIRLRKEAQMHMVDQTSMMSIERM